jgi:hypothetical protein
LNVAPDSDYQSHDQSLYLLSVLAILHSYSAQQARNPVPMIIEKISHLLELLHTATTQSDQYLVDLQKSNSFLQALRQKNMVPWIIIVYVSRRSHLPDRRTAFFPAGGKV